VRGFEDAAVVDVAVVGSSVAFRGVLADEVEAAMAEAAVVSNGSTPGKPIDLVAWWTRNVLVPLAAPDVVVVAITSRDLVLAGEQQTGVRAIFEATPGWAFVERGDMTLVLNALAAGGDGSYRAALRRPDLVAEPLAEGWDPAAAGFEEPGWLTEQLSEGWDPAAAGFEEPGWLTEQLWETSCNQVRDIDRGVFGGADEAQQQAYFERELSPWDPDPALDVLTDLVRNLRDGGISVVVVALPVPDDYLAAHAAGGISHQEFRDRLADLSAAEEIVVLDATDAFRSQDSMFRDIRHLNVTGAEAFSRLLGPVLDDPDTPRLVCVDCG
jgi:hypothetical protein